MATDKERLEALTDRAKKTLNDFKTRVDFDNSWASSKRANANASWTGQFASINSVIPGFISKIKWDYIIESNKDYMIIRIEATKNDTSFFPTLKSELTSGGALIANETATTFDIRV